MLDVSNAKKSVIVWSVLALLTWAGILTLHKVASQAYVWLGSEDKPGENMTSVFYLAAGVLVLVRVVAALRSGGAPAQAVIPFLIATFFIFVGGEEISWGQRLFGFETPEAISSNNVQGEATLHNLAIFDRGGAILNQHTMLNLIALTMGVMIPLCYRFVPMARVMADRLGYPAPPVSVVLWFVVGLLHGQTIAKSSPHWSHTEIKELIFSFGFFLSAWAYFRSTNRD